MYQYVIIRTDIPLGHQLNCCAHAAALATAKFINDKNMDFSEIVHETDYPNLYFVPGDALFVGTANLPYFRKKKIMSEIAKLDADWVILDLGSGSSTNTIDFFYSLQI